MDALLKMQIGLILTYDAIPDNIDSCPLIPETYNGFEDTDGCPDDNSIELVFDQDSDTIPDLEDHCPLISETFNNFQDEDGCPDTLAIDSDFDGVQDFLDLCPDTLETWNGFADYDGCPDEVVNPDSDYDGILDIDDNCINERERYNNFEDEDGCPDISPDTLGTLILIMMELEILLINVLLQKKLTIIIKMKTVALILL